MLLLYHMQLVTFEFLLVLYIYYCSLVAISVKPWEDVITALPTRVMEENITPVAFAIHYVSSYGRAASCQFIQPQ